MLNYILFVLLLITINTVGTQAYNLVLGYTGIFHLGHVGFYAIGAYTAAILSTSFGFSFWLTLPISFIITAVAGFLIAIPAIRLKSHFLALATLGFGEIIRLVLLNWDSLTDGPLGINQIPAPAIGNWIFDTNIEKLLLYLVIAGIIQFLIYRIIHSPYGKILETIREDEIAAEAIGKNTTRYKLEILSLSAGIAGIAGALYAHALHFIDPMLYQIHQMIFVLIVLITGGIGNFWGAIAGPAIIYGIFEPLRFLGSSAEIFGIQLNIGALRMLLYAILFLLIILFKPQGIMATREGKRSVLSGAQRLSENNLQKQ